MSSSINSPPTSTPEEVRKFIFVLNHIHVSKQRLSTFQILFELLHTELIRDLLNKTSPKEKETAISSLELIGYNTGFRLIEKLTRESPKFKDELDLMKFICKDFWTSIFRKQVEPNTY